MQEKRRPRPDELPSGFGMKIKKRPMPANVRNDPRENEFLGLLNAERTKHGLKPFRINGLLWGAAQYKANDLAELRGHQEPSHTTNDGLSGIQNIRRMGYTGVYVTELLASGALNSEEAVVVLMESPSHRDGILDDRFMECGVGFAFTPYHDYHYYWVVTLGGSGVAKPEREQKIVPIRPEVKVEDPPLITVPVPPPLSPVIDSLIAARQRAMRPRREQPAPQPTSQILKPSIAEQPPVEGNIPPRRGPVPKKSVD